MRYAKVKRQADTVIAVVALVVASPGLAVAALAIRLEDGGSVFFRQQRVGQDLEPFTVLKLRTMGQHHNAHFDGQTYDTSPGVTRVGRILRRLKIDELPQLVNIIQGDMALIGPRPCLPQTVEEMPEWAKVRFVVKPGLTGLAQVNGNAALPWSVRWEYDARYVESASLRLDCRILADTLRTIAFGERVVASRKLA